MSIWSRIVIHAWVVCLASTRDEYGYPGCESIVRAYVRERKLEVRDVFLPLELEAGKHAQCDWLTVVVVLGGTCP
ncbi:MAG: hypothetical protein ACM3ZU_01635 [Bacteroidota bacterium]